MSRGKCVPDCDINQCRSNPKPNCPANSNCKDLCTGYECVCKKGLSKNNSGECCDKEQCKTGTACPANSTCEEKCIGYECICDAGYSKKNGKCVQESLIQFVFCFSGKAKNLTFGEVLVKKFESNSNFVGKN